MYITRNLEEEHQKSPDGIDQQKNKAERVRYPVALGEGVPESTGRSDVLLQQVAANDEAYQHSDPAVPQAVCEEARRHNQEKNQ